MRHAVAGRKLGRPTSQREALLRNLATDLIRYERIRTTLPKAKALRPFAEKIITLSKDDTVHHRRLAAAQLYDELMVKKLFTELGPRFAERPGGYTRIVHLGRRLGDAAEMAVIELVE
ncbi:MAG TPA: 50S ribosomal protein L17 [Chloroflexota bacterium]|nr:50S ribosomal protein L17 [Chloroflexota bacterium]